MRHSFRVGFVLALLCTLACGCTSSEAPMQERRADEAGKALKADEKLAQKTERKIKYTAEIKLIVKDFADAGVQLKQLVKDNKGYVALSEESASPGSVRQGHWRVRVPVERYETFREAVLKLGEAEKNTSEAQDVTEEYYDLKSHIKNKLAEEEGLRKILEKTADKSDIEAFLKVKSKLDEVRDYVNRQEGKLKVLENLTDLTTITVHLREKERYDPEKAPEGRERPTFAQRVGRTFDNSVQALVGFGQGVLLLVVGSAPWLGPLAVVVVPCWLVWRRRHAGLRHKMTDGPAMPAAEPNQSAPEQ